MSETKIKSTGLIMLNGGVQEYGDPIAIPKQKKIIGEDIHIDSQGYLVKRPGKSLTGPGFGGTDKTLLWWPGDNNPFEQISKVDAVWQGDPPVPAYDVGRNGYAFRCKRVLPIGYLYPPNLIVTNCPLFDGDPLNSCFALDFWVKFNEINDTSAYWQEYLISRSSNLPTGMSSTSSWGVLLIKDGTNLLLYMANAYMSPKQFIPIGSLPITGNIGYQVVDKSWHHIKWLYEKGYNTTWFDEVKKTDKLYYTFIVNPANFFFMIGKLLGEHWDVLLEDIKILVPPDPVSFDGVHEYIDPDDTTHLLVKIGNTVSEVNNNVAAVVDDGIADERVHFFTHRGRCRYNGPTIQRKITRTIPDRVGIDPPDIDQEPQIIDSGGGTITGDYAYKYTFVINDSNGDLLWESNPSPAAQKNLSSATVSIKCSASDDERVNARNVYRTTAGGAVYQYAGQIPDNNSDTTFSDTVTDAELGDVLEITHGVPAHAGIAEGANEIQFFLDGNILRWSEQAYTESYLEYEQEVSFKELPSGGAGTGLKRLYNETTGRDDLLIFQIDSCHILPGADPNQPMVTLSHYKGCVQQDTIVEYDGGLAWLTKDKEVMYYKGGLVDISTKTIPVMMSSLVGCETASASLIYGHYYALCCRKDLTRLYNHQIIVFDLDTIASLKGGEERAFATCDCWRWNVNAQYILQTRDGNIYIFDNNSVRMFGLSLLQPFDMNPDASTTEIVAKFQTKYFTEGLYTRSQPISVRVKGEQNGTMKITPYFIDNWASHGPDGTPIINVGTVAVTGHAVTGHAATTQVQKHIETKFSTSKAGECLGLYFEKSSRDIYFKISAFELLYRTISRV